MRPGQERGLRLWVALLACLACTTTPHAPQPVPRADPAALQGALANFDYPPLDPAQLRAEPEAQTVESSLLLSVYTWLHRRDYDSYRLDFPAWDVDEAHGHLLIPRRPGRHALVIVFPILGGTHIVSEGLAKALVNRGYAVVWLERRPLLLETSSDPGAVGDALRGSVLDARRLLDWAVHQPRIDPTRIASAGVSLGSLQALLLAATDPRVRGGFFALTGAGLPDLLYDSNEGSVRLFRKRMMRKFGISSREEFVSRLRPYTEAVDPLSYAQRLDPRALLIASGRFDRVMPPARTRELWEALGRPSWIRVPSGHYEFLPFFWWMTNRGADHLDRLLPAAQESRESPAE